MPHILLQKDHITSSYHLFEATQVKTTTIWTNAMSVFGYPTNDNSVNNFKHQCMTKLFV